MKLLATVTLIPALALGFFACSSDDETTPEPEPSVVAVSYNGGLARGFVEATDARAELTTAALAELAADVLCVQEFWLPEHVDALKTATQASYPSSVFLAPDPGQPVGGAACTPTDTADLVTCLIDAGCDQECPDNQVACGLAACPTFIFGPTGLPSSCLGCIQANIGNSIDDILATCESESTEYAYGGSFGIGLLTHYDILEQDTLVMDSTTNRRGVAYARLDTPLGEIHTFCTHLTAVFSDIDYPKPTGSWEEEQAAQIDEMIAWAESKAAGGQIMLLGDMNTGPDGDSYDPEVPQNYQKFLDAGYSAPYVDTPSAPCTFCADNPIVAKGNDDNTSVVIDHVLTKGFSVSGQGTRVLDQGITVENCGETISSAYSDHYGISVTMQ